MSRPLERRRSRMAIRAVSLLTALVGVVDLISATTPGLPERVEVLEGLFPMEVRSGAHLFAAFSGFLLLTLALNLLRRKQVAWLLTCLLLLASSVSHLVKGLDVEESLLSTALLGLLLWMRPAFTARSDRPSIQRGLKVLLVAVLFTLAYGTVGFYLLDSHYAVNFEWGDALRQTLAMFFTENAAGLQPRTRFGSWFAGSIGSLGLLTIGYALLMLLRPVLLPPGAGAEERARARSIVAAHAASSLAAFALLPDKTLFFSPSGRSLIAYVARGRGAIALGDPIGPLDDRRETIAAFRAHCARNDWHPAFYQTLPDGLDLYRSEGFRVLKIGEEGIVDLTAFSLRGKAAQGLRTPLNKLGRLGHTVEFHGPPIADDLIEELRPVSDEWLRSVQGSEKKFSLGWFDPDCLRQSDITLVRTPEGPVSAFANLITGVRPGEVMVDMMRSRTTLEPGTMDFLFVSILQRYRDAGYERFDLGLSALSGVGGTQESPRLERAMARLARHLERFYGFRGLHGWKSKFGPRWEPRFLVYPSLSSLPDVTLALVRADSGDRLLDYLRPD